MIFGSSLSAIALNVGSSPLTLIVRVVGFELGQRDQLLGFVRIVEFLIGQAVDAVDVLLAHGRRHVRGVGPGGLVDGDGSASLDLVGVRRAGARLGNDGLGRVFLDPVIDEVRRPRLLDRLGVGESADFRVFRMVDRKAARPVEESTSGTTFVKNALVALEAAKLGEPAHAKSTAPVKSTALIVLVVVIVKNPVGQCRPLSTAGASVSSMSKT